MPRQLIGNINKQQQQGQQGQPSVKDTLMGVGKNIAGFGANILPTIGNIVGSNLGGVGGAAAGAAGGALIPGADLTGVPEVAGGIAGEIAGRAGGGAVGQGAGEMMREFIRQNMLGLEKSNPIQNKKEQQQALEEGGIYGLMPFSNGSKGLLGLLKHAVAGGGVSGAAQVIENLNNGKPAADNVGWQAALGGITNSIIGGAFDRNYETVQLTKDGKPEDLFKAAKTSPKQFTEQVTQQVKELRQTYQTLIKQSQYEADQTEQKIQGLLKGKKAPAQDIIDKLDSYASGHNYNFRSQNKNKMVHGTIDQIKQLLLDSANKSEADPEIQNRSGLPYTSTVGDPATLKDPNAAHPNRIIRPDPKSQVTDKNYYQAQTLKGQIKSVQQDINDIMSKGTDGSGRLYERDLPALNNRLKNLQGKMDSLPKSIAETQQTQTTKGAIQNKPPYATPQGRYGYLDSRKFKTIDQIKANTPVDVSTINEAKRLITKSGLYKEPVFTQMYGYLRDFVEKASGSPDEIHSLNEDARQHSITTQAYNDHKDKLTKEYIDDAVRQLVEKGSTTGLTRVQKGLKMMGMVTGMLLGRAMGHPFVMTRVGETAGESLGKGQASNISNILKMFQDQQVQQLVQQGAMRGTHQLGNTMQQSTGY